MLRYFHAHSFSRYIERFRHGTPMSRDDRQKKHISKTEDFWWLKHKEGKKIVSAKPDTALRAPSDSSTPKDEGGKIQSRLGKTTVITNPARNIAEREGTVRFIFNLTFFSCCFNRYKLH